MIVEQTGGIYHPDFAKITTDGTGSDPVLYDRGGNVVSTSADPASGTNLAPGVNQSDVTPAGDATARSWPSPASGTKGSIWFSGVPVSGSAQQAQTTASAPAKLLGTPPARDSHSWLDNIVVGPEARARWAKRLEQHFGSPVGSVSGRDQYVLRVGNRLTEVLVDPAIGAPVEENLVVDGQLRLHKTHEFEQLRAGVFVKTITRAELAIGQSNSHVVFVSRLANVVLEHR
jgi:hypothetical protein